MMRLCVDDEDACHDRVALSPVVPITMVPITKVQTSA
jgi:hypothetical protein